MSLPAELFFQMLSDPTRLRALVLIGQERELCVCEITRALDLMQPKVSRHLAVLKEAGILVATRQGQWMHYRLHPELPPWMRACLETAVAQLAGESAFLADMARLESMAGRPEKICGVG